MEVQTKTAQSTVRQAPRVFKRASLTSCYRQPSDRQQLPVVIRLMGAPSQGEPSNPRDPNRSLVLSTSAGLRHACYAWSVSMFRMAVPISNSSYRFRKSLKRCELSSSKSSERLCRIKRVHFEKDPSNTCGT